MAADRDTALRLRAYVLGTPLLRLEYRPKPVMPVKDRMLVAFVRMGGESSPWGVAWKRGKGAVQIRVVPEARNRSDVAAMVAEFGDELAPHFDPGAKSIRQLWLPGPTHAEMLHFLSLRYTRAKKADAAVLERLNRLGRRSGQLFDATQNPNSALCIDATAALRELLVFPCEPVRESHLGFVLALLDDGTRDERMARAKAAEVLPVSTSLEPALERSLAPRVEAWGEAGSESSKKPHADAIRAVLEPELQRRLQLLATAIERYEKAAPENPGVEAITTTSEAALKRFADREAAAPEFARSPETDHSPITAAQAYANRDADTIAALASLVPFDRASQEELIAAGSAFEADVISVEDVTVGRQARRKQLVVAIDGALPLRLRVQDSVSIAGDTEGRGGWKIVDIADDPSAGLRHVTLVSLSADPSSPRLRKGSAGVVFHELFDDQLRRRLARMAADTKQRADIGDAAGAWILEKLSERERVDPAPDTEHFDGTKTRVTEDG